MRARGTGSSLLALAVIVSAVNLRTAVTSVGALLHELETELGMSAQQTGLLTALPVITFGVVGWQAPRLARLVGDGSALAASLIVMTAGLLLRSFATEPTGFLVATMLALMGGAVGNVTIPTIIKAAFPHRIGAMTAAYVSALAIGQSLAAGFSIPAARFAGDTNWRVGIGVWSVVSLLSVLPWLAIPSAARGHKGNGRSRLDNWTLAKSRTVWLVTVYFTTQSAQVFVVFGWFTTFFRDAGLDANKAASLVAVYSLLFIPISLLVPFAMTRARLQTLMLVTPSVCGAAAYLGMLSWAGSGAWVWIILVSAGNAAFPAVLTLFTLRTQSAATTAALAAFAQSIGYLLASLGPLLVGWLRGLTHSWTGPMTVLLVLAAVQLLVGLPLSRERYVETDLQTLAGPPSPLR